MNDLIKEGCLLIGSGFIAIIILAGVNHFITSYDNQSIHESAVIYQSEPAKVTEMKKAEMGISNLELDKTAENAQVNQKLKTTKP